MTDIKADLLKVRGYLADIYNWPEEGRTIAISRKAINHLDAVIAGLPEKVSLEEAYQVFHAAIMTGADFKGGVKTVFDCAGVPYCD